MESKQGDAVSAPQWTPGPWKVCRAQPQEIGFDAPDRWRTVATAPAAGLGNADGAALTEAKANARLIASAPELAEALRNLADYAHGQSFGGECDVCGETPFAADCVVGTALAALAKAEGRA